MIITFKGTPMTLTGTQMKVGDKFPDFILTDNGFAPVSGKDLTGIKVFVVIPSLDTGVCDLEVRNFNKKASELSGVGIYAVSVDLPFAQARWCGANSISEVKTLSDYKDRSFGFSTGTFIEELALLTRAVFIVDNSNTVVYAEYVPEVSNHPEYDKIYTKLADITNQTTSS